MTSQNPASDSFQAAQQVLKQTFGYDDFRSHQAEIVQAVLAGQNCQVIMPTGMGKSLCFQVPAIVLANQARTELANADDSTDARPGLTLVLSPLIALMKDQVDSLVAKGVRATFVNSSLKRHERLERYQQIADGQFDLVYVAPERFRKPDFCEIATATPDVQQDIIKQLGLSDDQMQLFHAGIDRPNLRLDVKHVWDDDEKLAAVIELRKRICGSSIVYFTLIRKLREFSDRLWAENIPHLVYHGDLDRERRRELQDSFMNQPGHLVLATNAFGMGVDKEDIRFVLHCDLPNSLESYYQEIGRAGRDGNDSECVLLYDQRDLATQMEFMKWSNPDAEFYHRVFDLLKNEIEQINAFGMDWLRDKLLHKQKHDRRLETVLSMLFRWGVIEGCLTPELDLAVVDELPPQLCDSAVIDAKLKRDQTKLLTMVQYVNHDDDRKAFIHKYFGLTYDGVG